MTYKVTELAWPGGDTPGELCFKENISISQSDAIRGAINTFVSQDRKALIKALAPVTGLAGRYCLTIDDENWFLRISARIGHPELERALIDYLESCGISVNPIVWSDQVACNGETYRIDIRPFIQGRHFNGSLEDIASIASVLGNMHKELRNFSGRALVKEIASERNERIASMKCKLKEALSARAYHIFGKEKDWAEKNERFLWELTEKIEPTFHNMPSAQCLHGEIHPANVIFLHGKPILIDLEESTHVFAPPAWDMAYFIQRFCLTDHPDSKKLSVHLAVIEKKYGAKLPGIFGIMQQLAWFSILVILDLYVSFNITTPASEYQKFVRLAEQAKIFGELS